MPTASCQGSAAEPGPVVPASLCRTLRGHSGAGRPSGWLVDPPTANRDRVDVALAGDKQRGVY